MVSHDDVCDSCGTVGRVSTTRWPDGSRWEMCGPCQRKWLYTWRWFCERQPDQADRVRRQANRETLARPDDGQPVTDGGQSTDGTKRSDYPDVVELVDGEKPDWTDPTACPYPDCDTRGGQLRIEYHLSEDHGWFLIETDFESEVLADDREIDTGEQATLGEVGR